MSWGRGNQLIYSGSSNRHILEWDIKTGQPNYKWKADKQSVNCVCCHDDGELLLSAGRGIKLWSLNDYSLLKVLRSRCAVECDLVVYCYIECDPCIVFVFDTHTHAHTHTHTHTHTHKHTHTHTHTCTHTHNTHTHTHTEIHRTQYECKMDGICRY